LIPVERQVMIDQVFMKWDFEATLQAYGTFGDPAAGIARLYVSTSIQQRAFTNASGYSNPTVDDLFAKGAQKAKPEERAQFYYQVQEILADDVPSLITTDIGHIEAASSKFQLADTLWAQGYASAGWDEVWQK
jgi:peptide/nickel transport system substrate-binding protein